MNTLVSISTRWVREAVRETVSTFAIPAAQIAWSCEGTIDQVEIGSATRATRFPLGSVTKVLTASLALQLAGDGSLGLDEPIGTVLPAVAHAPLGRVTMRQLLSHSSGVANDHSSGRLDFASARELVSACADDRLLFPPGALFSYSNAGYAVAGHVVEAVTGLAWAEAAQAFLLDPLEVRGQFYLSGAAGSSDLPEPHVRRPDGRVVVAAPLPFGPGWAPAAGLALDARGLLRLVALHLAGGSTDQAIPLLEPALVAEARSRQAPVADRSFADAWGLGWALFAGGAWFGHSGNTGGCMARVRASARAGFAVAMLANAEPADAEWRQLLGTLAALGLDVGDPAPVAPAAAASAIDPAVAGCYQNGSMRFAVEPRAGGWRLSVDGRTMELRSTGRDRCLGVPDEGGAARSLVFLRDERDRVRYLHLDGRIARRRDGS